MREGKYMIFYGAGAAGSGHRREGMGCQDHHRIFRLQNGGMGLVCADGVSSASMAQLASARASRTAEDFIKRNYPLKGDNASVLALLNGAMNCSMKALWQLARDGGQEEGEYDTTLMIALMTGSGEEEGTQGHSVYTAGVGDGGIIGLSDSGRYQILYEPVKAEDGSSVIPLRWGPSCWQIKKAEGRYVSVLAATDGLLDALFMPPILKLDPYGPRMDIPMLQDFMNPEVLGEKAESRRMLQEYVEGRILDGGDLAEVTDDDRTVLALIDPVCRVPVLEPSYYEAPDYTRLQQVQDDLIRGIMSDAREVSSKVWSPVTPEFFWSLSVRRRGDACQGEKQVT